MKRPLLVGLALLLAGCSDAPPADGPGLNVSFLDMPAGMIPAAVKSISIDVYTDGRDGGPANSQHTVMALVDNDGDGRLDVTQPDLPTNVRVRVVVTGLDMSMQPVYVGHVGPMVLAAGERRYVDLALYPIGTATAITTSVYAPSLFPTATALLDGRVLIAGGFTAPMVLPACPGGLPATTKCLLAAATRDAYVFSPDSGQFFKLTSGLLSARGGQSATRLTDGRVLVAGGASSLLIVATPLGPTPATPMGYSLDFQPRNMTNAVVTVASFELFDPDQGTVADPLREGDPQRGGFLGAADAPTMPGPLNHGRMLHAAALVPRPTGDLVLLAGGQGSPDTWEVWDAHRTGGYGVYASPGALLHTARTYPSAITVGPAATPTVWIVGGAAATSNDDLAEIWTPAMMTGNGTSAIAATPPSLYPNQSATMTADHPEYALSRPELGLVGMGSSMVIAGWLGAHCPVGSGATGMPIFYGAGMMGDEQCDQRSPQIRSATATVTLATGAALPESMPSQHGFGSSVAMSDGAFALVGGFATITQGVQTTIDVFDGTVVSNHAHLLASPHVALSHPRALHASAALNGRGMLVVGGLTLDAMTLAPTLVAQPEVLYLGAAN